MKSSIRTHLSWSVVSLALFGCGPSGDAATSAIGEDTGSIIGGVADTGDPSVVAIYALPPGATDGFLCTGSLIAPSVILTAAHCVSPAETGAGTRFTVIVGPRVDGQGIQRLDVRSVHANPRWNPDNLEAGHDQGIVVLREPTTLQPLPFNRQALANTLVGKRLRLVGYGLSNGVRQTGAGIKRQTLTTLRAIYPTMIRVGTPSRGTCGGDSGGPAFMTIGGVETIVGTTSYGNLDCTDGGYDARVDTDLAFIEQHLGGVCTPACDGRSCGGDGCGGSCGSCAEADLCSAEGKCLPPRPAACAAGASEQEPNDSALMANPLCAGVTRGGTISSSRDQDWYTWTVPADVVYTVSLWPAAADPALRVYKIASNGRLSFIGDGPAVTRHTDSGGTYVARISTSASINTSYVVAVDTTP